MTNNPFDYDIGNGYDVLTPREHEEMLDQEYEERQNRLKEELGDDYEDPMDGHPW